MPRPRQRVCLQDGLKLDLNRLIRQGTVRPGTRTGPYLFRWTNNYTGEVVASGEITSDLCSREEGWFRFEADDLDQRIILVARPRHFGGAQWYFVCPVMNRRASVLWMPPGAERFCSRQTWGRRVVAYRSQFRGEPMGIEISWLTSPRPSINKDSLGAFRRGCTPRAGRRCHQQPRW